MPAGSGREGNEGRKGNLQLLALNSEKEVERALSPLTMPGPSPGDPGFPALLSATRDHWVGIGPSGARAIGRLASRGPQKGHVRPTSTPTAAPSGGN